MLKIQGRIGLACLVPLLGLLGFAAASVWSSWTDYRAAKTVAQVAMLAPAAGELIHQLQKERGASSGFVSSHGATMGDVLRTQWPKTDKAAAAFRASARSLAKAGADPEVLAQANTVEAALAQLPALRTEVSNLRQPQAEVVKAYTGDIAKGLGLVDAMTRAAVAGDMPRAALTFSALAHGKERAGQERAAGAGGLAAPQFPPAALARFIQLSGMQQAAFEDISRYGTPRQQALWNAEQAAPAAAQVEQLRAAIAEAAAGGAPPVDSQAWFKAATARIDALHQLETAYGADLRAAAEAAAERAAWDLGLRLALALLITAAAGTVSWLAARSITRPLADLNRDMEALAGGDTGIALKSAERSDEVGDMGRTVAAFRQAAVEKSALESQTESERQAVEAERRRNEAAAKASAEEQAQVVAVLAARLERLAAGDLTCGIEEPFAPAYEQLRLDFNAAAAGLQDAMRAVTAKTQGLRMSTEEIAQASGDLSQRTESQAASLEQAAAALDQLTATVNRSAEGARTASVSVSEARGDAEQGGEVVREAVAVMKEIEASSAQITRIVGVIDEMALRTNLLALNAGVEAARAGESGKGFAVVAQEVRVLAQRSAEAAKEINSLIAESTTHIGRGVQLVDQTGQRLELIVGKVAAVDGLVSEIAVAAQEQATGLAEINTAVNQMDRMTQQNAAMVEQATAATRSLSDETGDLARLVGRFRVAGDEAADTEPEPLQAVG